MPAGWHEQTYSDETERLIDHAVRDLVGRALDRAVGILKRHRQLLEKTAQVLLEKETLDKQELDALRAQIVPERAAQTDQGKPAVSAAS